MPNRLMSKPHGRALSLDDQQRLLDQAPSLVCIGGFDGYLKHVHPATAAALGYTAEEMTAVPMIELVHPDDRSWAGGLLVDFASGQSVRCVEVRIRTKDGSYKWVLWDAVPRIEEGFFLAMGQDITARKAVEAELRESQQRFHLIASATDEGIWDWDLRADRIWRNEAYHKAFGVPDDVTEGTIEWWRSRIHPDDLERVLAQIPAPIIDGSQKWILEYRMRRSDGTYAHVYDRGFVIFGRDGAPVRMVGSVMDISKLKHAELQLRESEERFRLAARATRDPIFDWDMRKGKVWRSEGFETLFGYTHESVSDDLGWWIEQTHPDDRERVCAAVSSAGSDATQQHAIEYRFRRADGTYADVLERAFVMYDAEGKPARMVGSLMDISERRRAQEMLHMQQAELAHIARVSTMGEIATGLAHELNQPLAAIANYAEGCLQALASQAPDREQKLRAWVEKIAANTHRAGEIIRRLRAYTRKSEARREDTDVNDLVREVVELVEHEARRQNMRVRWKPAKPVRVVVDPVQVQQVLVNLLHNAFEAAVDLPPERRLVTIDAQPSGDRIELSVADLGRGIPPENRDRVFDAFFTTKPSGVGIGLAISRSIVEDHGGRLTLHANPTHGVTFRLTLPVSEISNGLHAARNGRR